MTYEWRWPWITNLQSNRNHLLIDVYQYTKFEEYEVKFSLGIDFTNCFERPKMLPGMSDLKLWTIDLRSIRDHSLIDLYQCTMLKGYEV